jgi:hypothetical protein
VSADIKQKSALQARNEELAEIIHDCRRDPLQFVMRMYPWGHEGPLMNKRPREWQVDFLEELRAAMEAGHTKIFGDIVSGHGIGKSALISWLSQWLILSGHTRGIITANTGAQLATKTMPEVNKWFGLCYASHWMEFNATSLRRATGVSQRSESNQDWRIDALPWVKEKPDAFGGLHNEGGNVLLVFDEASGIHRIIWETVEGAMSDKDSFMLWLRFGNGLRNTGRFAELFRERPTAIGHTIRQHVDSRNVEGLDHEYIQAKIDENGGEDSDYAKSRWRGEFPDQSDWQLIDTAVVDAAMRNEDPRSVLTDPIIMGIDFARAGADKTVIRLRKGHDAKSFPSFRFDRSVGKNSMDLAGRISKIINETKPHYIFADSGGIGGPIIDRLEQMGHSIFPVDAGSASPDPKRWHNKRAYIWCMFNDWLKEGAALPKEGTLRNQITQQEFFFRKDNNSITLVAKEDMRDEGLESPDEAEALIQTFGHEVAPLNDPRDAAGSARRKSADMDYHPFSRL